MPNIANYLSPVGESRAADAWTRILAKSTSIEVLRNKTTLAAQMVRIETDTNTTEVRGEGDSSSARQRVIVFGIRNHPTQPDTDLKRNDRFAVNGVQYKVLHLVFQTGELQAQCEALA